MTTMQVTKSDFIKFNVSPKFKAMAEKKAREHGMTISELGRMLFGAFVTGMAKTSFDISPEFLELVEKAKENHRKGLGTLVKTREGLESYLATF